VFNGRVHRYAGGYWLKFEIMKVTARRGHELDYSSTLHGPDNRRLIGFDNERGDLTLEQGVGMVASRLADAYRIPN
jgi:hypothetical protein